MLDARKDEPQSRDYGKDGEILFLFNIRTILTNRDPSMKIQIAQFCILSTLLYNVETFKA